jgi:hypothetical protein
LAEVPLSPVLTVIEVASSENQNDQNMALDEPLHAKV